MMYNIDDIEECRMELQNKINSDITSWAKEMKDAQFKDWAIARQIQIVLERISKNIRSEE